MSKPLILSPGVREAVAAAARSAMPILDDLVAHCPPTPKVRVILALSKVKQSHRRARRKALRELDRVVTDLFPPVEGAPLPSEELNGKPDVLPNIVICSSEPSTFVGSTAPYWCGPVKPSPYGRFAYPSTFPIIGGESQLQYTSKK